MPHQSLPPSWTSTTLGYICHKPEYGWTTKATNLTEGLKLLRTTDISRGAIDWESVPYCDQAPPSQDKYILRPGDIVISRAGSVGASALIGACPESVFASYLIRFRLREDINKGYVSWFLKSPAYWEQIAEQSAGIALQNVNAKKLSAVTLPLPPLPEQHRIVAEIEKQFTRLDASVAALKRAQANLRRYRASVLKSACEGMLVPTEAELARAEGRDYEPADVLLQRILAERRARWESQEKRRGKYKEPSPPDTSELPELAEGWEWANLDQVVFSLEGGAAVTATDSPSDRMVLRSSAVRHGYIDLGDYRFLPVNGPKAFDPYISMGDLLFTRLSGTLDYVGNCAVVAELSGRLMEFPDRIFRGRCTPSISPHFIQYCFADKTMRKSLENKAKSTAGHQRISLSDLREYRFPLPPLAEQHRIVTEVERRLSVIQQSEVVVGASLVRAERLRQSILKQAFSGQLVPQDPTDEPASVLLEHIKAEREAAREAEAAKPRPRRPRAASSRRGKATKER